MTFFPFFFCCEIFIFISEFDNNIVFAILKNNSKTFFSAVECDAACKIAEKLSILSKCAHLLDSAAQRRHAVAAPRQKAKKCAHKHFCILIC